MISRSLDDNSRVFAPQSMMWLICRERAILLHGPAAAIMQVAHPKVGAGVAEHSGFQNSPTDRLFRTLDAVYTIAFGTRRDAEAAAARLSRRHASVRSDGADPSSSGIAYQADDPDLLMWVLATLVISSINGFEQAVRPLSLHEKQRFHDDMRTFGTFFNLPRSFGPQTWEQFTAYYDDAIRHPQLGTHPVSLRMAWDVARPRGRWLWLIARPLRFIYSEILPSPVRERLGFRQTPASRLAMRLASILLPRIVPWTPAWLRYPSQYRLARNTAKKQAACSMTEYDCD